MKFFIYAEGTYGKKNEICEINITFNCNSFNLIEATKFIKNKAISEGFDINKLIMKSVCKIED